MPADVKGPLCGLVLACAVVAVACERPDAQTETLRSALTSPSLSWQALGEASRDALGTAARDARDANLWIESVPTDLAADDLAGLLAAFDEARLRGGRDVFVAGRYTFDAERAEVRAERCDGPLALSWATEAEGPRLRWADGTPHGDLDGRLRGWLRGCGVDGGGDLAVVELEQAPFLAAVWPEQRVVFVHRWLAPTLAADVSAGRTRDSLITTGHALHEGSFEDCLTALRDTCTPCAADRNAPGCNDDLTWQGPFAVLNGAQGWSCNVVASLDAQHPWLADAICAGHMMRHHFQCALCEDPEYDTRCIDEVVPLEGRGEVDLPFDYLSQYRASARQVCQVTLETCRQHELNGTMCTVPEPQMPMPPLEELPDSFEGCVTALQARCNDCITPGTPSTCPALFQSSTIEEDCVDLDFPTFDSAASLSMYCAWQSSARVSCLNAYETCVRPEVEVVSYDTLVLGYGAFVDESRRDRCLAQLEACEAGMGIATLPTDTTPPWTEPTNQTDDGGCTCGEDC